MSRSNPKPRLTKKVIRGLQHVATFGSCLAGPCADDINYGHNGTGLDEREMDDWIAASAYVQDLIAWSDREAAQ